VSPAVEALFSFIGVALLYSTSLLSGVIAINVKQLLQAAKVRTEIFKTVSNK
jgi:hypothetical protein